MDTARVLVLFAHPAIRKSRVNIRLRDAIADLDGVTLHDLYETYPDFTIDVDHEQALLVEHDIIVFQHPLYWYSVPAMLKEWLDLVLEHGFAYGRHGDALASKAWLHAITTGGREEQYRAAGMNRFTLDEFLRPFEATAKLCGMRWRAPFVLHATHTTDATGIAEAGQAYRARLEALRAEPKPVVPRAISRATGA